MDLGLKGKVALVTGGGSGIGGGISEYLACEGANIAVNYIVNKEEVEKFARELSDKYGTECVAVYGDVSKADDIDAMLDNVEKSLGVVEILVNNAGVWPTEDAIEAGINMLTRTFARELSPKGIRVVAIAPGMVRTPINEDKWSQDGMEEYYMKRIPVGRLAEPIEIGHLVAFLASNKAANITGTVVDVTGGMLI